jgi:hypothetical protein
MQNSSQQSPVLRFAPNDSAYMIKLPSKRPIVPKNTIFGDALIEPYNPDKKESQSGVRCPCCDFTWHKPRETISRRESVSYIIYDE